MILAVEKNTGESSINAWEQLLSKDYWVKLFSRDNPARLLFLAYLLFLFIGYALYLVTYFMPTPHWGRELVIWATPIAQGLDTAARVAVERQTDPFPAQVIILYCAFGMVILTAGGGLYLCNHREWREVCLRKLMEAYGHGWKEKLKVLMSGLWVGGILPFLYYCMIFCSVTTISWRDHRLYSSSIGAISFFLLATVLMSFGASMSPLSLLLAFKSHATSSNKGE